MTPLIDAANALLELLPFIVPVARGSAPAYTHARFDQAVAELRRQVAAAERDIQDAADHGRL